MYDTWEEARAAKKREQERDELEWAAETARREKYQAELDAEDARRGRDLARAERDSQYDELQDEIEVLGGEVSDLCKFKDLVETFLQEQRLLQKFYVWCAGRES